MEVITLNNKKYTLAEDVIKAAPIWCKGIRNGRELTKKKTIDSKYFVYARMTEGEWVPNEGKSVKYDKVLIRNIYLDKVESYQNEINNEDVEDENGVEKAPEIIDLDDEEKFKDDEGNILEIETRGERQHDKIYFKVKDVSKGFEMLNLYVTLINNQNVNSYEKIKHYKYFMCESLIKNEKKTSKKIVVKELFLTYNGMLRVLFNSRSGKAENFVTWATEKLFTLQMGTTEQKQKIASDIMGVSAEAIAQVFSKDAKTLPCVYFFTLGLVKDLRKSMKISEDCDDKSVVGMYGFTKDLSRRTGEHIKSYSKIKGCNLKLKWYSYVDPQYMSKAESDVRSCMVALDSHLEYKNEKELVVLTNEYFKIVQMQYENVASKYMGHISELIAKIKEMENQLQLAEKDKTILKEQHKNELQQKEIELLKKDLEIAKLSSKTKKTK
jgi:hypothetical protein